MSCVLGCVAGWPVVRIRLQVPTFRVRLDVGAVAVAARCLGGEVNFASAVASPAAIASPADIASPTAISAAVTISTAAAAAAAALFGFDGSVSFLHCFKN